jgi:hypothetical protein
MQDNHMQKETLYNHRQQNLTLFAQMARRVLVPMWQAAIDAILLGTLITTILLASSILFTFPWLLILTYALVYLAAFVLRLRKAAYAANFVLNQDPDLEAANETLVSEKTRIAWMLFWGNGHSGI